MLKAGVRINKLFSENCETKISDTRGFDRCFRKKRSQGSSWLLFFRFKSNRGSPVRKKEKYARRRSAACALSGAATAWNVYCLRFHFSLAADKLPLLPCSRLCEAGPALFILVAREYRNHRGCTIPRFHFSPATVKFPLPVPRLLS